MMLAETNDLLYILVEGSSDCSVIDPHLNSEICETLPSGGKSVVVAAIELAREEGFDRLAAALDLDWADLLYPKIEREEVFYTDDYDIDATVFFREQNMARVAASFAARTQLKAHVEKTGYTSLHEMVTNIAYPIGLLRFISEKKRLELYLRDFPVSMVLNSDVTGINFDKLIHLTLKRSPQAQISADELIGLYREIDDQIQDTRRYCSGHELLSILATILYRKCGSKASVDAVSRAARATFSCSDVAESRLFRGVNEWGVARGKEILSCM
jgi:hypothetical protein